MKLFNYLLAGILCASVTCLPAQHRADPQKLVNPESFSMILLGDPQGYTKYDINQPLFDLCTAWIADNIESLKIKAVLCTGDLVEQNDNNVLNRKMLNQTSREMWEAASQALKRLDNKVPYTISHEAPDCPASLYHCTQTRNVAILHLPVPLVTVHRYFLLFRPKLHDKYHRPHYASTSSSHYAIRHRPYKLTGTHSGLFHHLWLLSPKTQQ